MYGLSNVPVPWDGRLFDLFTVGVAVLLVLLIPVLALTDSMGSLKRLSLGRPLFVPGLLLSVLEDGITLPEGPGTKVLPNTELLGGVLVTSVTPIGRVLLLLVLCRIGSVSGVNRVE